MLSFFYTCFMDKVKFFKNIVEHNTPLQLHLSGYFSAVSVHLPLFFRFRKIFIQTSVKESFDGYSLALPGFLAEFFQLIVYFFV